MFARLNKFLVVDDQDNLFGVAVQTLLPRYTSDHYPILWEGGGPTNKGPLPCRFENMWLKTKGFGNLVEQG